MLTEEQLEILSDALSPLYQQLEAAAIADIARRINKTMIYTRTAELQVMALRELGYSPSRIRAEVMKKLRADKDFQKLIEQNTLEYKQEIKKLIQGITEQAQAAGNDIVANAGEMSWVDDMRVWEDAGKELGTHSRLDQIITAIQRQTAGELRNLTKTTGFKSQSGWEGIQSLYRMELDKALVKMSSGAFSSDQCVRDVVKDLSQSGLRTIDYASGRSYQLDTAVRMCLRTAGNQIAAQTMNVNLESTEISLVQVSAHWGARNKGEGIANHEQWQGLVCSVDGRPHPEEERRIGQQIGDLKEATGYDVHTGQGLIEGLHGINCRHQHFAFFEGVSNPVKYPPEPKPKDINGRKYDYYAMTQKQRQLERGIRALKREKEALKALGQDTHAVAAQIKLKTAEYKQFSAQCGISLKANRLRVESGTSDLTKTEAWKTYQEEKEAVAKQPVRDTSVSEMLEYRKFGKVDTSIFENKFGELQTDEVILTNERMAHIKERHPEDIELFEKYGKQCIDSPDLIISDEKNEGTVFMIKTVAETNLNVVLRLALGQDERKLKNSVMTFWRIRKRNLKKLIEKNELLYKKE